MGMEGMPIKKRSLYSIDNIKTKEAITWDGESGIRSFQ